MDPLLTLQLIPCCIVSTGMHFGSPSSKLEMVQQLMANVFPAMKSKNIQMCQVTGEKSDLSKQSKIN